MTERWRELTGVAIRFRWEVVRFSTFRLRLFYYITPQFNFLLFMAFILFLAFLQANLITNSLPHSDPVVQSYTQQDYQAHGQNMDVLHASNELIYVGNRYGVLEFDGSEWNLIPSEDRRTVFTLAEFSDGMIYAGSEQMFARLKIRPTGKTVLESLNHLFPGEGQPGSITQMEVVNEKELYFYDGESLYLFQSEAIREISISRKISFIAAIHGHLYLTDSHQRLYRLHNRKEIPVSEFNGHKISALAEMDQDRILVASDKGLFIYENGTANRLEVNFGDNDPPESISHLLVNSNSEIVAGTPRQGVYIIGAEGEFISNLTTQQGLNDEGVNSLTNDRDDGVWVGQNRGLNRIGEPAELTIYSDDNGLFGVVEQIEVHDGKRYISGQQGLQVMQSEEDDQSARFEFVEGLQDTCFEMLPTNYGLLAACNDGVYIISKGKASVVADLPGSIVLTRSAADASLVYLGTTDGMYLLRDRGTGWELSDRSVPQISGYIRHIIEADDGTVWIATRLNDLQRITGLHQKDKDLRVEHYGTANGLPDGRYRIFNLFGQAVASTQDGLHRFTDTGQFKRDEHLADLIPGDGMPNRMAVMPDSTILFSTGYDNGKLVPGDDGSFSYKPIAAGLLPEKLTFSVKPGTQDTAWYGGEYGIAQIHLLETNTDQQARIPQFRTISSTQTDSLLALQPSQPTELNHHVKGVRFSFASPVFDDRSILYRTRLLEGERGNWSDWGKLRQREFSNLKSGSYEFQVQAKFTEGSESKIASHSFVILPPWYQSVPAIILWVMCAIGLMAGFVKFRMIKLRADNEKLERIISSRTKEIEKQKNKIERQAQKLAKLDEMKSRFFTNLSHEFRTPLTLIQGPLEDLRNEKHGELNERQSELASVSYHNSHKLLHLINQLLEISKLEAGFVRLQPEVTRIDHFLQSIYTAFLPLAERHRIDLKFSAPKEPVISRIDADKVEKIVGNLLSNAFKATEKGGVINLGVELIEENECGFILFEVTDNGVGISEEKQRMIFDRYIQSGTNPKQQRAGTGIGLNLVRELTELHGGSISVESEPGKGSTFKVKLPHRKPEFPSADHKKTDRNRSQIAKTSVFNLKDGEKNDSEDVTTVLVIDDNHEIRSYICSHLQDEFHLLEAEDGRAGMNIATEMLPDLILSDVMMPEMDGFELVKELKSNPHTDSIPIILLTARASEKQKVEGIGTGVDDYLTKPFNADELIARVKNLISNRKKLKDKYSSSLTLESLDIEIQSEEEQFITSMMECISQNLSAPDYSSEKLANQLAVSISQLQRKTKSVCGLTPNQLIRKTRLSQAKLFLEQGAENVSEIAYAVGFNSLSYFTRVYREEYGCSPSESKKSVESGDQKES